jgi:hypothetical protein
LNRRRRRSRGSGSLVVATAALLLITVGLVAVGISLRSDASEARSEAAPEVERLRAQVAAQRGDVLALEKLQRRAARVRASLEGLMGAVRAQVDASNHAAAATNFVGDLYNSGDGEGARRALESDVMKSALADLDRNAQRVARAVAKAQEAAGVLQVVDSD